MKQLTSTTYQDLKKFVSAARFPKNSQKIQDILEGAFKQIDENLRTPYFLHKGTRPTRVGFGTDLPKGQRDETMLRHFLNAELFRSWILAYQEVPVINNKGYPATPFVIFAEHIYRLLGIGKIEDHLEEFQSFRVKSIKNTEIS